MFQQINSFTFKGEENVLFRYAPLRPIYTEKIGISIFPSIQVSIKLSICSILFSLEIDFTIHKIWRTKCYFMTVNMLFSVAVCSDSFCYNNRLNKIKTIANREKYKNVSLTFRVREFTDTIDFNRCQKEFRKLLLLESESEQSC